MTGQVSEKVTCDGNPYCLVDTNAGLVFNPRHYGLEPIPISTACYRGFIGAYAIRDGQLFVDRLETSCGEPDQKTPWPARKALPVFNGRSPKYHYAEHPMCDGLYEDLQLVVRYTGQFLMSRNRDGSHSPRFAGYARAWDYDTSLLVTVVDGSVTSLCDVSDKIATFGARYLDEGQIGWDQRQNARRFLKRHFGPGFSIWPNGGESCN